MCIFKKIPKLGLILFSSVFHSKVWIFFSFKLHQSKFFSAIFFRPKNLSFSDHSISAALFDLHNTIRRKQSFGPTSPTDCLPPRVNPDVTGLRLSADAARCHAATSSGHPSMWEPRATPHAREPRATKALGAS
jgi:hypothetical protein